MKLKTRQLSLNHVIGFSTTLNLKEDIFDQVAEAGKQFKQLLIQNGYYSDGPVIFEYNPFDETGEITLLTTIGNKVNITGENKSQFFFREHLGFTTDYFYRHYDQEEEVPYDELKNRIEAEEGILLTIYHILLDLAGDMVVDLYCEVDKI